MNQMNNMKKYADLALQKGINLQKGQALVVSASVENADLVRLIGKRAYELGAKEVHVNWRDGVLTQLKFKHAPLEIFEDFPDWYAQAQVDYAKKGAGFLTITGDDPQLLNGISSEKIAANNRSSSLKMKEFRKYTMGNFNSWCIIAAPTIGWAEALYDDAVEEEEKIDRLWTAIFKANRVDQADPIAAWENHLSLLAEKVDLLNAKQYRRFVITSDNGTSLDIRLPNHHIWWGGGEENKQGTYFVANMPTEEVFTAPEKTGVNGKVYGTKPLYYSGNLIDEFFFTFKDGEVVEYGAKVGEEVLKDMISMDEGAKYLGELALVPYDSPISNTKMLFKNTLFDENASCHLALGKAYPTCIENGENLEEKELENRGLNDSLIHVDFMFGHQTTKITAYHDDDETGTLLFENGNWA